MKLLVGVKGLVEFKEEAFKQAVKKHEGVLDFDTHAWTLEGGSFEEDGTYELVFDFVDKGVAMENLNYPWEKDSGTHDVDTETHFGLPTLFDEVEKEVEGPELKSFGLSEPNGVGTME